MPLSARSFWGGARQGGPIRNLLHILYIYVIRLAYNGAQTTMVASGDRVSHVNGWSFHSDLPELTQDANMDSAQLLPAAVRASHDLSSHGSRRSTNPFAAVIWQASSSTLALLSPTVRVIFSSSSSVCYTCEHGSRASQIMGRRVRPCAQTYPSRRKPHSYDNRKQQRLGARQRARPMASVHLC